MVELFKILEGMTPNYLSELFIKADTPYDTRDKCKLMQPLKRTSTCGLRSFQYYGAHVWNIISINIKAAQPLHKFKPLIRSWPGPTCSCQICTALLWLMIDWLIVFISINATPIHVHWELGCRCDDYVVACGTAGCLWDGLRCHR